MNNETMSYGYIHTPTLGERFWRALGFRYHLGEDPEDVDTLQGWTRTDTRLHFHWTDRFRLLLTGRLMVSTISHYDAPSPTVIKNRTDWQIRAPGE
ncbi:hypothetical protein [Mesorhizobium ciceri]|uniref:hypothetical protein n=1 Tax=Mesorhizobium TaxID=68287 RepID=UPI00047AC76D|nr:hypothetical protein [Mesorhizobium ciceri]